MSTRLWASIFGVMIAVGLGLVALSWMGPGDPGPDVPEWHPRSEPKPHFAGHVKPGDGFGTAATRFSALLATLAAQSLEAKKLRIAVRMTRVIRSGHEFDIPFVITTEPSASGSRLRFDIATGSDRQRAYEVSVVDGRVTAVVAEQPDGSGGLLRVELGAAELAGASRLPLAVGDFNVRDAGAFLHALSGRTTLEPLGLVAQASSDRLLVLALDLSGTSWFAEKESATESEDPVIGRGASALVYVSTADSRLRAIRVFDADERLVRTYDGFIYGDGLHALVPKRFRVTAVPSASHTRFTIEELELVD